LKPGALSSAMGQLNSAVVPGTLWANSQPCLVVRQQAKRVRPALLGAAVQVEIRKQRLEIETSFSLDRKLTRKQRVETRRLSSYGLQLDSTAAQPPPRCSAASWI
jgi:hypothetical protein